MNSTLVDPIPVTAARRSGRRRLVCIETWTTTCRCRTMIQWRAPASTEYADAVGPQPRAAPRACSAATAHGLRPAPATRRHPGRRDGWTHRTSRRTESRRAPAPATRRGHDDRAEASEHRAVQAPAAPSRCRSSSGRRRRTRCRTSETIRPAPATTSPETEQRSRRPSRSARRSAPQQRRDARRCGFRRLPMYSRSALGLDLRQQVLDDVADEPDAQVEPRFSTRSARGGTFPSVVRLIGFLRPSSQSPSSPSAWCSPRTASSSAAKALKQAITLTMSATR